MQRTLVWDLPTRVFHWALASCFALGWLTSGSDVWLPQHVFLGYAMLLLLGFRLVWGLVGGTYARFTSFAFGPKQALAYLRDTLRSRAKRHIGHNPAGSQAIYLLLLLALLIGISGILTLGAEERHGIAAGWFDWSQGESLKEVHESLATAMLLVVAGHLAGVVLESLLHKENLARSMLTGVKLAPASTPASKAHALAALLLLSALASLALWWFSYALRTPPGVAFVGPRLAQSAQWRDECGSCHLDFHPSLLPRRSWNRLLQQQDRHFGADLGLDAATTAALANFASGNAAERHQTEAAYKIERSLGPQTVALRITETPYWVGKHREIGNPIWNLAWIKSKANCTACHADAADGTFEDGAMQIPQKAPVVR